MSSGYNIPLVTALCDISPDVFSMSRSEQVEHLSSIREADIGTARLFYARNHVTSGMSEFLRGAVKRLSGQSQQAVFELRQAMGGGKTHNMIALGLLARFPELRELLPEAITAGMVEEPAVIATVNGRDVHNFIWGDIAEQLGRAEEFRDHWVSGPKAMSEGDWMRLIGELISATHPTEPVAVYAGVGKSGILLDGEWRSIDREDIKRGVKERKLRVVCATDAACEGLNLQTLGTLINVDLPWNPSRLEQRIGRIKRYGQQRREVDMANLVYAGTIDEKVYQRLSERMQDRYDILGSLPDTIEDDWIEDIEKVEAELKSFTKPESPADVFSLRYGDFLTVDGEDRGWEVWTKVVARRDIEERLMRPWNGRGGAL